MSADHAFIPIDQRRRSAEGAGVFATCWEIVAQHWPRPAFRLTQASRLPLYSPGSKASLIRSLETQLRYKGSLGEVSGVDAQDYMTYGGTASVHERSHRDGQTAEQRSEHAAYTEQLRVLQKFGPKAFKSRDFYNNAVQHVTSGSRRPD